METENGPQHHAGERAEDEEDPGTKRGLLGVARFGGFGGFGGHRADRVKVVLLDQLVDVRLEDVEGAVQLVVTKRDWDDALVVQQTDSVFAAMTFVQMEGYVR